MTPFEADTTAFISSLAEGFFERRFEAPLNAFEDRRLNVIEEALTELSGHEEYATEPEVLAPVVGAVAVEEKPPVVEDSPRLTVIDGELAIKSAREAAFEAHGDDDGRTLGDFMAEYEAA